MIDNNQNGREGTPEPDDQSLDRGYGGLPGKQPGEDLDDTVTKQPAKNKVRPKGRQPAATKH